MHVCSLRASSRHELELGKRLKQLFTTSRYVASCCRLSQLNSSCRAEGSSTSSPGGSSWTISSKQRI
eukprot:8881339-Pyramimonas_sp.AAC.1